MTRCIFTTRAVPGDPNSARVILSTSVVDRVGADGREAVCNTTEHVNTDGAPLPVDRALSISLNAQQYADLSIYRYLAISMQLRPQRRLDRP